MGEERDGQAELEEEAGTATRRAAVPQQPATPSSRRPRRRLVTGMLVGVEAPDLGDHRWVVDAVDLSSNGMGLVLPDDIPPGSSVLLTLRLSEGCDLARVPATVLHREPQASAGGVSFDTWNAADRLCLLEHLVHWYEGDE
jgi:hypothetical protein